MPQLDHVTYLSQYFWMFVLYFALYYGVTKLWLPRMSRILALRQAKLQGVDASNTSSDTETQQLYHHVHGVYAQAHREARGAYTHAVQAGEAWTQATLHQMYGSHYTPADRAYLQDMAQTMVSQEVALYHAKAKAPVGVSLCAFLTHLKGASLS